MSSDLPARPPGPVVRLVARPIAPCAEMPNDNPALHAGAIWGNDDVVGAPSLHPAHPAVVDDAVQQSERPDPFTATSGVLPALDELVPPPRHSEIRRLTPTGELGESLLEPSPAAPPVLAVVPPPAAARPSSAEAPSIAEPPAPGAGAAAEATPAAALLAILAATVEAHGGEDARARLLALLDTGPDGAAPAARLARGYRGWARTLAGEDVDFAETGGTMLDEWAALACSAALGEGVAVTALRRELRARGVAAFGLVDAA